MNKTTNTDIKEFIKGKFAVHCKTEKDARNFLKQCHNEGVKWSSGQDLTESTNWNVYREKTLYIIESGNFGNLPLKGRMYYGSINSSIGNIPLIEFSKFKANNKYVRVD